MKVPHLLWPISYFDHDPIFRYEINTKRHGMATDRQFLSKKRIIKNSITSHFV